MISETTAFCSFHANSSAMVLRMCEIGEAPDRVVHAATGKEFDFVYEFAERFQKICPAEVIIEDITTEKPEFKFENFFNKPWCRGQFTGEIHGFPLNSFPCWHNRNVKEPVYIKYENISRETYTGFHAGERHRRIKNKRCIHRYPLMEWGWGWRDSLAYLKKRGIPHIGYEKYGFDRLGCWLCPRQGDKELYILYKHYPDLFGWLQDMEEKSPHGFRPKGNRTLSELVEIWERNGDHKLSEYSGGF